MNRYFDKRNYWLYIVLVTALLNACKKSDTLDTKELYAYASPGNSAYNVVTGSNFTIIRSTILPGANTGFPVLLTRAIDKDVQVTGTIDTSLLASYDSINKTTSLRFGAGNFKLDKNGMVTIKAGQTASSDSIQVLLADTTGINLSKTYVVPVRLTASTAGVPLSNTRQVIYVKAGFTKVVSSVASGLLTVNAGFTASLKAGPTVGFPAAVNYALSKSITVSFADDASLVVAYNTANKTNYTAIPAGAYTLVKNSVTIAAGATTSADSVKIQFPDLSVFTAGTSYLLPVKIKDEGDVPPGATNNIKYILLKPVAAAAAIPTSGSGTINVTFVKPPAGDVIGPAQTGFGAALNVALSAAVQVGIVYDATLVAAYNTAHKTNFSAFPSGSFTVSKDNVTIAAGATTSGTDSFHIRFSNYNAFTQGNTYLLPLKIKDGGSVNAGTNNIVYVAVTVQVQNIDPSNNGLSGTTMNRSKWKTTAGDDYYGYYPASNAIDGDLSTFWLGQRNPQWIQVDMGAAQTVKGFNINSADLSGAGDFYGDITEMEVLSSDDGNIWKSEGKYSGPPAATQSDIKTVKFITPVTARYFKFNITKTADGYYAGMAELNGIQ